MYSLKNKLNKILEFIEDKNDVEKPPIQLQLKEKTEYNDCFDWNDLLSKKDHRVSYRLQQLIRINKILKSNTLDKLIFKIWNAHAEYLVYKMSKIFLSYNRVVTSRLHGHILSCLVDVPSTVIDNSYGKNTAYYEL